MPFNTTQDLPNDPQVRIFFSGQLILSPADTSSAGEPNCEVFINSRAGNHSFSVEARQKRPGLPDGILMRTFGPLQPIGPSLGEPGNIHGMLIGVTPGGITPGSLPRGVKAYDGSTPSTEGTTSGNIFSLVELHRGDPPSVHVRTDKANTRPSIFLNDAVLYTADRTPLQFDLARGGVTKRLTEFAGIIGANIYPTLQQSVVMTWKQNGQLLTLPFEPPPAAGPRFTYEVYVSNDPLFDPDAFTTPTSAHDELAEYYKVLPGIPHEQRFTLTLVTSAAVPDKERGTPRTLCMSALGEG